MPRKKKETTNSRDDLVDFYKELPPALLKEYHNPHFEKHKISVPFYGIICGGTGAGKTQTLMNILRQMNGTFEKIILCLKTSEEPLYKWLKSKIPYPQLEIFEEGAVPDVNKYLDFEGQILVVFDDLVNMKNQRPIEEWYIRGRKCAGGCSMIYLTQSWFKTPKMIRVQANHIFLKRLTSLRDLNLIINEYGLKSMKNDIIKQYRHVTQESKVPFFLIRTDVDPQERFSRNFKNYIPINDNL